MSENLAKISMWNIIDQNMMGSDHFPINCKIGLEISKIDIGMIPRWKLKSADWDIFQEECVQNWLNLSCLIEDVEQYNNEICENLCKVAGKVIGKSVGRIKKKIYLGGLLSVAR